MTPSAISQRLKALESSAGRVLVVRSRPVRATASGEVLLRLARQVELLTAGTAAQLGNGTERRAPAVPIAVNADSLATWLLPALAPLADGLCPELHREDQARTGDLLRSGTGMAAVTAEAEPVPGCTVNPLGRMRYRPRASRRFLQRWFSEGATESALAVAPVVVFDRHDQLQDDYLRRFATCHQTVHPPVHRVHVDVVLHWQQWKLRCPALDLVAAAVLTAARAQLRP